MAESTKNERDRMRDLIGHGINEDGTAAKCLRDADRCARIDRCCLLRSETEAPEWAREWIKYRPGGPIPSWRHGEEGRCYWLDGRGGYATAPDLRPDEPGPITLPILEC